MSKIILSGLLFLTLFVVAISGIKISRCNLNEDIEADNKIADLISFSISRDVPENEQVYNEFCRHASQMMGYMGSYSKKCLETNSRRIMNTILYTVKRTHKKFCRKNAYRSEFVQSLLQQAPCIRSARVSAVKCYEKMLERLDGIVEERNDKLKIPMSCCNWFSYRQCLIEAYEKSPACPNDAAQVVEQILEQNSQNAVNLVCRDLDESSDRCQNIIDLIPLRNPQSTPSRSPLIPMLKVLASIDE